MKVYAFDFDGTLTKKSTFFAFIRYAKGYLRTNIGLLLFSPILLLVRLRLYANWKAKQQLFSWYFKGMNIDEFDEKCRNFAQDKRNLMRKKGIETIGTALAEGDSIIVITASIENWVKPFFEEFADGVKVEGTHIDVRNKIITGKFLTKNCYGKEKIKRLIRVFPYRHSYTLVAFGDGKGDRHLLKEADESHYKPFRKSRFRKKD